MYEKTICLYTNDNLVTKKANEFASKFGFDVYFAECETDLIAIPSWLIILDIGKLEGCLYSYLDRLLNENEVLTQRIVSHTPLSIQLPEKYRLYIQWEPEISNEILLSKYYQFKGLELVFPTYQIHDLLIY